MQPRDTGTRRRPFAHFFLLIFTREIGLPSGVLVLLEFGWVSFRARSGCCSPLLLFLDS
jgi:hypothetical protein